MSPPVLEVRGLTKSFGITSALRGREMGSVLAVDHVSFSVRQGETLGLVGESGCGKSTIGRMVMGLLEPTSGAVLVNGQDIAKLPAEALRRARHQLQIVFQDPFGSLNPRLPVGEIISEPLYIQGRASAAERRDRAEYLLARVGLDPQHITRFPHEFSGGQRQRICIARALSAEPKFVVCDEAVSALDVSVQAQVINLLQDLQEEFGLSYLFIAHDLAVVRHISHRVAVMYLGQLMEIADRDRLYSRPLHPYTQALIGAVPVSHPRLRRKRQRLGGEQTTALRPPPGCRFSRRCPFAQEICRQEPPQLLQAAPGQSVACHMVQGTPEFDQNKVPDLALG